MTTYAIEQVFENKTQKMTYDEARDLYYENHTCDFDDSEKEEHRIERWIEDMGIEIID